MDANEAAIKLEGKHWGWRSGSERLSKRRRHRRPGLIAGRSRQHSSGFEDAPKVSDHAIRHRLCTRSRHGIIDEAQAPGSEPRTPGFRLEASSRRAWNASQSL